VSAPAKSLEHAADVENDGADIKAPEPWLRGTFREVPVVLRAVLHALQLAKEDVNKFAGGLTTEELHASPFGIPSVAFHLRHIARSIDRLLTHGEGQIVFHVSKHFD
jgi:hypothetical protein